MNAPGWRLHPLTGNLAGHYSVTVNGNWRMTFTFDGENAELALLDEGKAAFKPLYDAALPIKQKIETIAREIYGAAGVDYGAAAEKNIAQCEAMGLGDTPICVAKTQYSFSDDPTKLGRPTGFRLTIRDVYPSAGAGFVVALAGDIMTMPGLPKVPAAESIRVLPDGTIEGLF